MKTESRLSWIVRAAPDVPAGPIPRMTAKVR